MVDVIGLEAVVVELFVVGLFAGCRVSIDGNGRFVEGNVARRRKKVAGGGRFREKGCVKPFFDGLHLILDGERDAWQHREVAVVAATSRLHVWMNDA
jgi:hypothetical protein